MNRNEINAVELAEQTIWEGLRLYAEAKDTTIIENDCVSAVCTGVSYEGFNAAIGRGSIRPGQIDGRHGSLPRREHANALAPLAGGSRNRVCSARAGTCVPRRGARDGG